MSISLFDKYGANYLLISDKTLFEYKIDEVSYVTSDCFEKVKEIDDVMLYNVKCKVVSFESGI